MRRLLLALAVLACTSTVSAKVVIPPEHRVSNDNELTCFWACADTIGRACKIPELVGIRARVVKANGDAYKDGATPAEIHEQLWMDRVSSITSHKVGYNFFRQHAQARIPVIASVVQGEFMHALIITDVHDKWIRGRRHTFVVYIDPNFPTEDRTIEWWQFQQDLWPIAYTFARTVP